MTEKINEQMLAALKAAYPVVVFAVHEHGTEEGYGEMEPGWEGATDVMELIEAALKGGDDMSRFERFPGVPKRLRWAYTPTRLGQTLLWKLGVPVHNGLFGECTPNFSCCTAKDAP